MRVGDIVFHHAKRYLRGISRVTQEWVPDSGGWLVEVELFQENLAIHFGVVAELITVGPPGPFITTKDHPNGVTGEKYASLLSEDDARKILDHLEISLDDDAGQNEEATASAANIWSGDETYRRVMAFQRKEQHSLRRKLLRGRENAACDLCGKELPAGILVAAHIMPRRGLPEKERKDFDSIAMLACSLGCDKLFEDGYVAVDGSGRIVAAREPGTGDLSKHISALVGRSCGAHNDRTAPSFANHAALVVGAS